MRHEVSKPDIIMLTVTIQVKPIEDRDMLTTITGELQLCAIHMKQNPKPKTLNRQPQTENPKP